jgi:hypothetical protein
MIEIHKAALTRAYRTLAQGLAGSTTATALTAVITAAVGAGEDTARNGLIALAATLGSTVVAAFTSFWQGVAYGLPEVDDAGNDY